MIHSTAIIDPSAKIADNVKIGPYSIIGAKVEIGEGCDIRSHVVITGPCKMGKNNTIYQFASVGEDPQDKKYQGEESILIIGDNNTIREYCTFNRGTADDNGITKIGNNNLFLAYCHVAHDCTVGNDTVFANAASLAGHVTIEDKAILGGFTTVHQFTRVGRNVFCGMATAVTKDIPPFCTVAGNRAKTIGINKEGLKRNGFSPECIRALHKAFRLLLKSSKTREEALLELSESMDEYPEVNEFVDFVTSSKRGISR